MLKVLASYLYSVKYLRYFFVRIVDVIDFSKKYCLVFSHNRGGGTSSYERNNFYNGNYLIIRKLFLCNDFLFFIENGNRKILLTRKKLILCLERILTKEIIISSLVCYKNVEDFLLFIMKDCPTTYLVHDYHCICPNYSLIKDKKFCAFKCQSCIIRENAVNHRKEFSNLFNKVNKLVCFSNSSKELLLLFYPEVKDKILVKPHDMSYCKYSMIKKEYNKPVLGIVGNCSIYAKGYDIINTLLEDKEVNFKIVMIGKLDNVKRKNKSFVYYQKYQLSELPNIVLKEEVSLFLFPSIIPETFSYVVSEIMKFGLPIIGLNIGAQGEKLKSYKKGYLLNSLDSQNIIKTVKTIFSGEV